MEDGGLTFQKLVRWVRNRTRGKLTNPGTFFFKRNSLAFVAKARELNYFGNFLNHQATWDKSLAQGLSYSAIWGKCIQFIGLHRSKNGLFALGDELQATGD